MGLLRSVAVLLAVLPVASGAGAPTAGRIVFVREAGDQSALFSIRPDRSAFKRLADEPGYDHAPVWSPNGRLIASLGAAGIVISSASGFVVRRIAIPVEGSPDELRWSPDGRWLSFLVERCSYEDPRGYVIPPCGDLWVVDSGGQGAQRLMDRDVDMLDGEPSYSWSPSSRSLVYEELATGPRTLRIVQLGSSGGRRIPRTEGAADPTWSSRGQIALVLPRGLFSVRADGGRLRRLVRGTSLSRPLWSPDGRRLAYLSPERTKDGNRWGVWVTRADGRNRRRLGATTDDGRLVWSPDSTRVLWQTLLQRLYVARADGRARPTFLTRGSDPDWR